MNCFECGQIAQHEHHVIPRSLGGTRTVWLCERHHGMVHGLAFTNHGVLTRLGQARRRAEGYAAGPIPYGWKAAPDGKLEIDYHEVAVARQCRHLRERGLSLRAIAATLAERGIMARNGRPLTPQFVRLLCSRS
jgi:hypothetical protein